MCGYSSFAHCSFHNSKRKHDFDRDVDYMKKFCADLKKKHATDNKEMLPLTDEETES